MDTEMNKLEKRYFTQNWNRNHKLTNRKFKELRTPDDWLGFNCIFLHSNDVVNIKKKPGSTRNGRYHHYVDKNGKDKLYHEANAINCPKLIHAKYCNYLIPCVQFEDGTHAHIEESKVYLYEKMLVIARWDQTGVFFMGNIKRIDGDRVDVGFHNGRDQNNLIYKYVIAVPKRYQYIKLHDYVMANILNENDQDCWIPGQVINLMFYTGDDGFDRLLYRIRFYNGYESTLEQEQIIKINKKRYDLYRIYLLDLIQNKNEITDEDNRYIKTNKLQLDQIKYEAFELELIVFGRLYEKLKPNYKPIMQTSVSNYDEDIRESKHLSDNFLALRQKQSRLKVGQRVIAKWPGDCYYYECQVVKCDIGDDRYQLENILKDSKYVYREDIIVKESDDIKSNDLYDIGDTVIAQHPKFKFAYAPGEVIRYHNKPFKLMIRHYDFSESFPDKKHVYSLKRFKFQIDVSSIIDLENRWLGATVFTYNTLLKRFGTGVIKCRMHINRHFAITWPDGTETIQDAYSIFVPREVNQ